MIKVFVQENIVESGVLVPIRVTDIVDSDPGQEKRSSRFPAREGGVCAPRGWDAKVWKEEVLDLLFEGENIVAPGTDEF